MRVTTGKDGKPRYWITCKCKQELGPWLTPETADSGLRLHAQCKHGAWNQIKANNRATRRKLREIPTTEGS